MESIQSIHPGTKRINPQKPESHLELTAWENTGAERSGVSLPPPAGYPHWDPGTGVTSLPTSSTHRDGAWTVLARATVKRTLIRANKKLDARTASRWMDDFLNSALYQKGTVKFDRVYFDWRQSWTKHTDYLEPYVGG